MTYRVLCGVLFRVRVPTVDDPEQLIYHSRMIAISLPFPPYPGLNVTLPTPAAWNDDEGFIIEATINEVRLIDQLIIADMTCTNPTLSEECLLELSGIGYVGLGEMPEQYRAYDTCYKEPLVSQKDQRQ